MRFIELISKVKMVSLDTPYTNIILQRYVEDRNEEGLKELIKLTIKVLNS